MHKRAITVHMLHEHWNAETHPHHTGNNLYLSLSNAYVLFINILVVFIVATPRYNLTANLLPGHRNAHLILYQLLIMGTETSRMIQESKDIHVGQLQCSKTQYYNRIQHEGANSKQYINIGSISM